MRVSEVTARSILRKSSRVDSWFVSFCGMNLYRGCAHDCAYCDGRAEKYRVSGEFGTEVSVKVNALELLRRELGPRAPARPMSLELWPELKAPGAAPTRQRPGGFVLLGGGVGDAYQPAEEEYRLSRGALELLLERGLPVHILTKSTLVLRDLDLLERINASSRAAVSFSISSSDDAVSAVFEPGVPPPSQRLEALRELRSRGIPGGVFLMPVIPFVTDSAEMIDASVGCAKDAGAGWVVFAGMTMKEGRQKEHFRRVMAAARPEAVAPCMALYEDKDSWGSAKKGYYVSIERAYAAAARRHRIPPRIPRSVFSGILEGKALAVVLLEHIHAMLALDGRQSPFGWAAHLLSKMTRTPPDLDALGAPAAREAAQILAEGTSALYEELLSGYAPETLT